MLNSVSEREKLKTLEGRLGLIGFVIGVCLTVLFGVVSKEEVTEIGYKMTDVQLTKSSENNLWSLYKQKH